MSESVSFHLDEHISSAIAEGLQRRGIDVTTAAGVGLVGVEDERQLEFARQSGRVLVTQDKDFLRLHAQGAAHAGIAYCKQGTRTIGQMLHTLTLIYEFMTPDEIMGQVVYL